MKYVLTWHRQDDYHTATECGRYTIARVRMPDRDDYIAWSRLAPAVELGSLPVPLGAPDSLRAEAIQKLKQRCEEHHAKGVSA